MIEPSDDLGPEWTVLCHPADAERVAGMRGVGGSDGSPMRVSAMVPPGTAYVMASALLPDLDAPLDGEDAQDWVEILAEMREHYGPGPTEASVTVESVQTREGSDPPPPGSDPSV